MATALNKKITRTDTSTLAGYLFRLAAMAFAMLLLIFVPVLFLLTAIAPAQLDLFQILEEPLQVLIVVLAGAIAVFTVWGALAVVWNARRSRTQ
jgi:hypothetical protein